ncbi:MAG: hypothetical protein U1E76_17775 [Planctomycetota bacterium]
MKLVEASPDVRSFVDDLRNRGSLVLELLIDHCVADATTDEQILTALEGRLRALHEEVAICLNGAINFRSRHR